MAARMNFGGAPRRATMGTRRGTGRRPDIVATYSGARGQPAALGLRGAHPLDAGHRPVEVSRSPGEPNFENGKLVCPVSAFIPLRKGLVTRVADWTQKEEVRAAPGGWGKASRRSLFRRGPVRQSPTIALCRTVVLRLRVALQSAVPPRRNVFALTRHPLGTRSRRNSGRYSKERARKVKALRFPARTAHCETRARKRLQGIPSPVARSLRHFSPSAEPLRPTRELGVIQIRLIPVIFQSFIRPGERCEGRGEAPAGEVWPHTLLCGRQGVLGNWNPGITGLAGMRTKPMEEAGRGEGKYKDASTQQGKGLPWKEKRRRACPNGIRN